MGWIKELSELSPRIKSFVISMICLMPFWYICIFLFNPIIFSKPNCEPNFYLTIPLSFCFSILWYIFSLALNGITLFILNKIFKYDDTEEDKDAIVLLGGVEIGRAHV